MLSLGNISKKYFLKFIFNISTSKQPKNKKKIYIYFEAKKISIVFKNMMPPQK